MSICIYVATIVIALPSLVEFSSFFTAFMETCTLATSVAKEEKKERKRRANKSVEMVVEVDSVGI